MCNTVPTPTHPIEYQNQVRQLPHLVRIIRILLCTNEKVYFDLQNISTTTHRNNYPRQYSEDVCPDLHSANLIKTILKILGWIIMSSQIGITNYEKKFL